MRSSCLVVCLLLLCNAGRSQSIEAAFPASFKLDSDTLFVRFSNSNGRTALPLTNRDSIDMGTDGVEGLTITLYGVDSLVIPYKNLPYMEVYYITLLSPKGKTIYRMHFNSVMASFSSDYIARNTGGVQIEVPEVYELANIIWILSPSGQRRCDLSENNAYYARVKTYFGPYLDHPIFKQLSVPDSLYFNKYYDFRENSFAFSFEGDKIRARGPYYYVMGGDYSNFNSLFKELLPLVEDFAKRSSYRQFYRENQVYYTALIGEQAKLLPVKDMWTWLENNFRNALQSYKIVFSPLITGSHSTQRFSTYRGKWFREAVMFICGPEIFNGRNLDEKQKQGLMSGIVFTEIDHNYVNPASSRYSSAIDSIFSARDIWTTAGANTNWYSNSMAVFNEYMTHAAFCLWVEDYFNKETTQFVISEREKLMVERRQFIRFREFNKALSDIRSKNKGRRLEELYPDILAWCEKI